jgi:cytoskeleton protein RodZ
VALLALAAVVGSLYYVGRGVQNSSPNPSPPSSEDRAANGSKPEPNRGQAPAEEAPQKSDAASEPQPDILRVEVSVEGSPSWLSILTDGNLAYEQIAQPGFSQTFEARREISIKTGNAGAVGVEVNGQNLGKLGESGEVLTKEWTLKTAS